MSPDHWKARWFGVDRELSALESDSQRREVWQHATIETHRGMMFFISCGAVLVVLALLIYPMSLVLDFLQRHSGWNRSVLMILYMWGLMKVAGALAGLAMNRRTIQRSIRRQVRDLGIPLCQHCGYNLTGIGSGRCPECGHSAVKIPSLSANKTKG